MLSRKRRAPPQTSGELDSTRGRERGAAKRRRGYGLYRTVLALLNPAHPPEPPRILPLLNTSIKALT